MDHFDKIIEQSFNDLEKWEVVFMGEVVDLAYDRERDLFWVGYASHYKDKWNDQCFGGSGIFYHAKNLKEAKVLIDKMILEYSLNNN